MLRHKLLLLGGEMVDVQLSVGTGRKASRKRVRYRNRRDKIVAKRCVKVTCLVVINRRHSTWRRCVVTWRLICQGHELERIWIHQGWGESEVLEVSGGWVIGLDLIFIGTESATVSLLENLFSFGEKRV